MLFEIDRRPFETALAQATARLAEAQAQLAKAERDLARDEPLAEQRAIAQSQLDNDVSARDAAQAAVSSAKAAVEAAQLNLGFTRVTSLDRRRRGDRQSRRSAISSGRRRSSRRSRRSNPIKVYFPISEQEYLGDRRAGRARRAAAAKLWQAGGGLTLRARRRQHLPATRHRCSPWTARSIPRWARSA